MKTNIPKLRFIEFKDASAWEEKKLGEVITFNNGKYNPQKSTINYPDIELECLSQGTGRLLYTLNSLDFKSIKNIFDSESILFGKLRPYLKKFYLPNFEGVCSSEILSFRSDENRLYTYYVLQSNKFNNLLDKTSGTKMPRISSDDIKEFKTLFPFAAEQDKIGRFLSTLDKRIELQEKLVEKLEEDKKGYLQKLFPKKGKSIPKLRFDEFKGAGEWNYSTLSQLFEINNNGVDKKSSITNKRVNLLNYMDIYKKTIYTDVQTTATSQQLLSCNVLKNDLFITPSSETSIDILNAFCIDKEIENYVFSYHICRLRPIVKVNSKFVEYILNTDICRKEAAKLSNGITRFTLSKKTIEDFSMKLPKLEEQDAIVQFLKSIDESIFLQSQRIERLKNEKQALLNVILI